ncbi:hypothetical protein B0O99DRAFT_748992 [Bisporella sp. PMI_857]|nr:hypothetical protein B0O99DRAFT_748992 [Bisporella sp. PMI_857]
MKTIFPALALFATTIIAAAVPDEQGWYLRRTNEIHLEGLPIVDLEVTDERFEGMTFRSSAESVYNEMKALKPELFANKTEAVLNTASLEKRQSSFNCDWGGRWVTGSDCFEGVDYLIRLGTSWCGVNAAPACARVSCSHGCGIFLCNKLDHHLQVHCKDIATDVHDISWECVNSIGEINGARDFASHFIGIADQNC